MPDERVPETADDGVRPWQVPELPASLARSGMLLDRSDEHDGDCLTIGVTAGGGASGASEGPWVPVGLDLQPGTVVSVLGPPGSGRSTALISLAEAALDAGRDAVLIRREGPPDVASGLDAVDTSRSDATTCLAARLASAHRPVILVDDAGDLDDEQGRIVLGALPGAAIVVSATAAEVLGSYGGLLGASRKARSGLVLGVVGPADGEALGIRLGPWSGGPPGRGWLVRRGRVVAVQVAMPEPAGGTLGAGDGSAQATHAGDGSGREPARLR
jgi:DNA segregation ATPase FtsK/SpoIIIE, S-DNA-T family